MRPIAILATAALSLIALRSDSLEEHHQAIERAIALRDGVWARAAASADPIATLENIRRTEGLPLSFWPGPEARSDTTLAPLIHDHPCGYALVAIASRMPALDDTRTQPERVQELSPTGELILEWRMPIDNVVQAISRDRLIVPHRYSTRTGSLFEAALLIGPNGDYTVASRRSYPEPKYQECPVPPDEPSAYRGCWQYEDLETKKPRLLVYDGPCT